MNQWRHAIVRASMLGLIGLGLAAPTSAQTTIKGKLVYGDVNDDINEAPPPQQTWPPPLPPLSASPDGSPLCVSTTEEPCGFLAEGDPIAYVHVQLNAPNGMKDHTITDANGRFSMSVNGSPDLTLVVKAKNDYVKVKKYREPILATDDVVEIKIPLTIDYSQSVNDLGDVTVTDDDTDFWHLHNNTSKPKNYVSRAFYVATVAHESGSHLEQVMNGAPVSRDLEVRMGWTGTAFYLTRIAPLDPSRIFLANIDSATFWHEYGHFIEDRQGGFDLLPAYTADGQHRLCTEMTVSTPQDMCNLLPTVLGINCGSLPDNELSSLVWAWIEGFAQFLGTANTNHVYGGVTGADKALEHNYASETISCTNASTWNDPRAVESVVTEVLWDLVDTEEDAPNATGVDEIADADVAEVLEIFAQDVLGLDEFWDAWREREGAGVIVPDLYAAYAFNGAAVGNAADTQAPERPTLASSSHEILKWSNNPDVQLTVTDGQDGSPEDHDDVSGSYHYFVTVDGSPTTQPSTAGTATFKSWLTVTNQSIHVEDGKSRYIHVNTTDMAFHASGASHFGPVHIDTVDPYWVSPPQVEPYRVDPGATATNETLVLEYPAQIRWSAHDDASGVAEVRVTFKDPVSTFEKELLVTPMESRDFNWWVTGVPVTTTGLIVITVTDFAGNELVAQLPVDVVAHFKGPQTHSLGTDGAPCDEGRTTSGDLDRDGYDDVVAVCGVGAPGQLYVFKGSSHGLIPGQTMPWLAADDVVTADVDRDGDLDVLTVSLAFPAGSSTRLDVLRNDGTGTLGNALPWRSLGSLTRKTVRVLTPHNRRAPVAFVFGALASQGDLPDIRTFDFSAGMAELPTPGLDPVDGDWEMGDVNGDGYQDLVAVGGDGSGTEAVALFRGGAAGWTREDVDSCSGCNHPDVDVGDFDADGLLDLFVMFERPGILGSAPRITKLLRNAGGSFTTAASASEVAYRVARGDGFIVDTANDARSEVVAMGLDDDELVSGWYLRNDELVGLVDDAAAPGMSLLRDTDSAWGDFDRDGDLDLFQVGHNDAGFFAAEYESLLGDFISTNDAPAAPRNLNATYDAVRGGYDFTWTPPANDTDETRIAGLGYELRIGTTANGNQVLSWAHPAGASQQGRSLSRFVKMPAGTYHYDVRTVDSGWRRSAPAGVKTTSP
jgi:hypothetical protein